MGWMWLFIATAIQTGATYCMRASEGLRKRKYVVGMFAFYILSFTFLNLSLKTIELSVAYAFWSGFGTFLVAVMGYYIFKDKMTALKMISIALIIMGLVGLKLASDSHDEEEHAEATPTEQTIGAQPEPH